MAETEPAPNGADDADLDRRLEGMPAEVVAGMTDEQKQAVAATIQDPLRGYPVDIRFSIPLFGDTFFISIISSKDQRGAERRLSEGRTRPLLTLGNVIFMTITALIFFIGLTAVGSILLFLLGRWII